MRIAPKKLAVAAFVVVLLSYSWVSAQSAQPEYNATPSAQNAPATAATEPKSEEDQTEQFKHSASVRLLARATGLSLETAYWLAVVLNFAIVAGLIWWAAKKNLPAIFRNRT